MISSIIYYAIWYFFILFPLVAVISHSLFKEFRGVQGSQVSNRTAKDRGMLLLQVLWRWQMWPDWLHHLKSVTWFLTIFENHGFEMFWGISWSFFLLSFFFFFKQIKKDDSISYFLNDEPRIWSLAKFPESLQNHWSSDSVGDQSNNHTLWSNKNYSLNWVGCFLFLIFLKEIWLHNLAIKSFLCLKKVLWMTFCQTHCLSRRSGFLSIFEVIAQPIDRF